MRKTRIKAIIFDFDGVIAESVNVKTEAFAKLYEPYGEEVVGKVVEHHLAYGGVSRFEKFRFYHKDFLGIDITGEQIQELANQFSNLVVQKVVDAPYVPRALEFIKNNHKKYDLFVSTGTPENEMIEILEKRSIGQYFKGIYGSPASKSQHIENIINSNKYHREEVVFVGDSRTDKDAANESRVHFIARINKDNFFEDENYTFRDYGDLEDIIKKLQ